MERPLSKIRVLELSRVLAGPWAAQTLADLGADVIKVERPKIGDDTRSWGPPYLKDLDGNDTSESAYYLCANRGKRSVAIDFANSRGRDLVRELAQRSDVLIENFKVGTLARYGLDYQSLAALNPRLVYCSITGFGQTGPARELGGYDFLIQAMGGLMSVTGQSDAVPGAEPTKVGVPVADLFAALYSTIAIMAALAAREQSGLGQHLDIALFDVQLTMLANQASNWLTSGKSPVRLGNAHPNVVPYQPFSTADGIIVLAVGTDEQFRRCCRVMGRNDLAADPRFVTNSLRVKNRTELIGALGVTFRERSTAAWLEGLQAAKVPSGAINTIAEALAEPQAIARQARIDIPHPFGVVPMIASPIRMSETPVQYDRAPPLLGQHTEDVLESLDVSSEKMEALRKDGVIG